MNLIDKFTRRFRFGIPNLMIYITATMLAVFAIEFITGFSLTGYIYLSKNLVLQGQVWRLLTFIFVPINSSPLWILLSLYFYYFIGSSLENTWGVDQFTLYYLFGVLGCIISAMITGTGTNMYLNMSCFFAFASLFPNYTVMLFFLIPVKVKYLAYVNWAFFALSLINNNWPGRVAVVFALLNYFLFFGPDIFSTIRQNIRTSKRRREFQQQMRHNRDLWQ